ncbi:MAG: nucleotide exchange factor GrpE [Wenzhouxiangella sp.]
MGESQDKPAGEEQDLINEAGAVGSDDLESEPLEESQPMEEGASEQAPSDDQIRLEEEVGRLRDALLRTRAEMDNLHKRGDRELEKSRKFAVESLLRDLVPVIDSLDQGLESAGDSEALAEGLSLTRKLLVDTLSRYGLNVLNPVGERFDPQWHEAMSIQPSDEHEPDTVISVLQRGYRLHDRLLRPARVLVARETSSD